MTSNLFLDEADGWCAEAWDIVRRCGNLYFVIISKRIHRFEVELSEDWERGYENVTICESQNRSGYHLPVFLDLLIKQ